jgi:Ni/Co efflux regulator RcnB
MKRHLIIVLAAAIALLASCSAEQADTPNPTHEDSAKRAYLEVTAAQPVPPRDTRTAYKEDGNKDAPGLKVTWKKGDKLGVAAYQFGNYAGTLYKDEYLTAQDDNDDDNATTKFAGNVNNMSDNGKYIFYHPAIDGEIIRYFYNDALTDIKCDFTGQKVYLSNPLAELAKRDVLYTPQPVDPTGNTITLQRTVAALRFELKLPDGTPAIQSIGIHATSKLFPKTMYLTFNKKTEEINKGKFVEVFIRDLDNSLTLEVTDDPKAPAERTIIAYMMMPVGTNPISITSDNTITVTATDKDGKTYLRIFNPFDLDILPGHTYTFAPTNPLDIDRWASSNIYWDGEKLTFDLAGASNGNQLYQGVLFKWGSLVGISPAQTANKETGNPDEWSSDVKVFYPSYNRFTPTNTTWDKVKASDAKYPFIQDIPYIDIKGQDKGQDDLKDNADYTALKGDICRFLGLTNPALAGYRMPRSDEFGEKEDWEIKNNNWSRAYLDNEDGTADLSNRIYFRLKETTTMLPAAGLRNWNLGEVGEDGNYWSSSGRSISGYAYFLKFGRNIGVNVNNSGDRQYPRSVRCIKDK